MMEMTMPWAMVSRITIHLNSLKRPRGSKGRWPEALMLIVNLVDVLMS
jgi:hypothetical protein